MSLLQIRGASKAFGSLIAVNNVTLDIEPGELRAVIGPNGAGKTTFFNLITGFFPPSSGQILLDGKDITRATAVQRIRMGMARTFQITQIFPELSTRENIQIAAETAMGFRLRTWLSRTERAAVNERIEETLVAARLTEQADRLVGELAHGDQRSAEIAMALALKPRILLLDEPTAGMGEQETFQVAGLIRRLHKHTGYTIMLVEHDMRVVFNLADRIVVLTEGTMLAEGTPQEIAANPAVQAAYLGTAE